MSRLVARILLCLMVFPLAVVCFIATVMIVFGLHLQHGHDDNAFYAAAFSTSTFVAVYWTLIWRKSVRWTMRRRLAPYGVSLLGGFVGIFLIIGLTPRYDREPFFTFLFISALIAWLLTTIILWQESPAERADRLRISNQSSICCPTCGYNLTGLNEARCPECGAKFTLDELFASQPKETANGIEWTYLRSPTAPSFSLSLYSGGGLGWGSSRIIEGHA